MYLLLLICVFYMAVTATHHNAETRNNNEYEYGLGDVLQFSCNVTNSEWAKLYHIHHELGGVNYTIPINHTSMFQPIYIITAQDIDHGSKIYCIREKNQSDGKSQIIENKLILRMKSVSGELSAKCEINQDGDKSLHHSCTRQTSMNKIVVKNPLNEIQDIPLKIPNSGCLYYCVDISKINEGGNYERVISSKIKYLKKVTMKTMKIRYWLTVAVAAEVVAIIILVAIFIYLRKKRHRQTNNRGGFDPAPTQIIYAELELSNRTPSLITPVIDETPYAQVVGYLAKD